MHISFAGFEIYRDGGFPGRTETLEALIADGPRSSVGLEHAVELFPPACYHRPAFAFACDSEAFAAAITGGCDSINRQYVTAPAVMLAELVNARISGGMVATVAGDRTATLYETDAQAARRAVTGFPGGEGHHGHVPAVADEFLPVPPDGIVLWLGDGESVEERVWLTDHLARLAAVTVPQRGSRRIDILLERGTPASDFQRQGAIAAIMGERPYRLTFLDPARCYGVERLVVISPVSQPPFLKSPHALRHLRDVVAATTGTLPPPVPRKFYAFDSTAPGLPNVANQEALVAYLRGEGFSIVDLSLRSFKERADLFGSAELVVGPMQSALAGTVFCRPGTALVYLAAEDEPDPFFWDLAACCAHRYAACYGTPDAGGFTVEPSVLVDALALQWTALVQG